MHLTIEYYFVLLHLAIKIGWILVFLDEFLSTCTWENYASHALEIFFLMIYAIIGHARKLVLHAYHE